METVKLVHGDVSNEFEISHAERILTRPANMQDWKLPADSPYELIGPRLVKKQKASKKKK